MSINKKVIDKFTKAYEGIPATKPAIQFMEGSPYYHQEEWRYILPMYVRGMRVDIYVAVDSDLIFAKEPLDLNIEKRMGSEADS